MAGREQRSMATPGLVLRTCTLESSDVFLLVGSRRQGIGGPSRLFKSHSLYGRRVWIRYAMNAAEDFV